MRIKATPSAAFTPAALALAALALAGCGSSGSTSASASSAGSRAASSAASSSSSATASAAASSASSATASAAASAQSGPVIGFEGVPLEQGPLLAPADTTRDSPVDGISCDTHEQLVYHIHAHLAVFDDGRLYAIPAGVGIPGAIVQQTPVGPVVGSGRCFFWLHTHTTDGVIHIESPSRRIYTLGDFFDIWRQPLSAERIASLRGRVTTFVNGRLWTRSPRDVPLLPHEDIQLEIGEPAPPIVRIDWAKTQL
ncbi:MAG TPA: hypothetical protein VKV27_16750 [Solirubrobacteraceae bacterium]|nr:hypothetical protein [Solirubrobacteraceae bacterium]